MTNPRRSRLHLTSLTLALVALTGAVPIAAEASVSGPSVSSLVNTAKATIAKESGVHVLVTTKTSSPSTTIVADIGETNGVETITRGADEVTIRVTSTQAYLSGNAAGLTTLMGLSTKEQKKVGTDAISMKAGTSPYKSLASSTTIPVLANFLPAVKGTTYSTRTVDGHRYYELSWTTKATATTSESKTVLTLSSGPAILPIREFSTSSSGTGTTVFTKWGEHVRAVVPSTSQTISYAAVTS